MLYIGSSQASGIYLNTSIVSGYIGSNLFWPVAATYVLRDLVVHYSSGNALNPNCENYAYLTATLVTTWGDQTTSSTVTLTPSFYDPSNNYYVISGNNISANTNKKSELYEYKYTKFTGSYVVNGQQLTPSLGVTSSSVSLTANTSTQTSPAYIQTITLEAYLDNTDVSYLADSSTRVFVNHEYNSFGPQYTYTSGYQPTRDASYGLYATGIVPSSIRTNPTTNRTILDNRITVTANNSLNERTWNVFATYNSVESSNNCVLTQAAGQYAYGTPSVSIAYDLIDASGGTVTPDINYSQTYGWAPSTSGLGTITTGGDVYRYVEGSYSADGAVSGSNLGSSSYPDNIEKADDCYATVRLNGKIGESSHIKVYQSKNVVISTSAVIAINISNTAYYDGSTYTVGPQDAKYSLDPYSTRTETWTSRATSTSVVGKNNLTVTKGTGTWFSISNWDVSTNENTSTSSKSGYLTVKDNTYGSARLNLSQLPVVYQFEGWSPQGGVIYIAAADTAFDIYITSTRNYKPYSFSTSNIAFSNNSMTSLTKSSVNQSLFDPTVYTAHFTCAANSSTNSRGATITFTQPSSRNTVVYTLTQAAYEATQLSTSVQYITMNTTGGSSAYFDVSTNKNWSIDTNFAMCDFNGDSLGSDSAALSLSSSSGTSGITTIVVTRGSYTSNSIVDIKITAGSGSDVVTTHVIIAPTLSISNVITTWSAPATDGSTTAITTNYPSINWYSPESWLYGSDKKIYVEVNDGNASRSGSIQATGSLSGTFFGVPYFASAQSSNISVTQAYTASTTTIYIVGEKQDPNDLWISTSPYSFDGGINAPKDIYINNIDVYDGQGMQEWEGYAQITQGTRYGVISWDGGGLLDEVSRVVNPGYVVWSGNTAPTGYTLGSNNVIWL